MNFGNLSQIKQKDNTQSEKVEKERILLLNFEFPPIGGGGSKFSSDLAEYLARDYDIDVITMHYKGQPNFEYKNDLNIYRVFSFRNKKSISYFYQLLTYLFTATFKSVALIRSLRKEDKNGYKICHAHFALPTGIIALILKKLFKLPYILTCHGSDIPGYNLERFVFLHRFSRPILKIIFRNAKQVCFGSEYLMDLAKVNVADLPNYKKIRHGFKISKSYVVTDDLVLKKKKIILMSGRLLRRKGFIKVIDVFNNLKTDFELHIIGSGILDKEIKKRADKNPQIIFHGWLQNDSEKYLNILSKAAIYVLVSESENVPVALQEAMSFGCAVITSSNNGCRELVGDAGIWVHPNDTHDLKKQLDLLINDSYLRQSLGRQAIKRVTNYADFEECYRNYKEIL